jgi:ubiquinone/menaquinone biosynthesis C-methylase UbiE
MVDVFARIVRRVFRRPVRAVEMDPTSGYDLWSSTYDLETDNLLVTLDDEMFGRMLQRVPVRGKVIADVGCGTGRHWKKIIDRQPAELVGYDVSQGMLAQLLRKYPKATVHRAPADHLPNTRDQSCDVVVSTLTLCHVPTVEAAFAEWCRVLRPQGEILISDYHSATSATGNCCFRRDGQLVTVKLYVHPVASIKAAASAHGLELLGLEEVVIDESMKGHYASKNMLPVFERLRGVPILYGVRLRKLS